MLCDVAVCLLIYFAIVCFALCMQKALAIFYIKGIAKKKNILCKTKFFHTVFSSLLKDVVKFVMN